MLRWHVWVLWQWQVVVVCIDAAGVAAVHMVRESVAAVGVAVVC